jgi:hypothetical protein
VVNSIQIREIGRVSTYDSGVEHQDIQSRRASQYNPGSGLDGVEARQVQFDKLYVYVCGCHTFDLSDNSRSILDVPARDPELGQRVLGDFESGLRADAARGAGDCGVAG